MPCSKRCGLPSSSGFATSIVMWRIPPSSAIAASGSSSALPWNPSLFSTAFTPLPLIVLRHDHGRHACRLESLGVRGVDRLHVVTVDLDRLPAESLGSLRVRVEIPAVHRLAALAEPVHVDDRDQVVELLVPGVLERLPHRALGHLAVAAEHPDPVREPVEPLARERDADAVRQPLAQRAGRHVHPRQDRSRVPLEPASELAEREQLLVRDRARGLVHRVQERRRVPLGEDEMVVPRVVGFIEVVPEVLRQQDGHEVGRGHRRGRMARLGTAAARMESTRSCWPSSRQSSEPSIQVT